MDDGRVSLRSGRQDCSRMTGGVYKCWEREIPDPNWSGLHPFSEDMERTIELLMEHHLGDTMQTWVRRCMGNDPKARSKSCFAEVSVVDRNGELAGGS